MTVHLSAATQPSPEEKREGKGTEQGSSHSPASGDRSNIQELKLTVKLESRTGVHEKGLVQTERMGTGDRPQDAGTAAPRHCGLRLKVMKRRGLVRDFESCPAF